MRIIINSARDKVEKTTAKVVLVVTEQLVTGTATGSDNTYAKIEGRRKKK